MEDANLRKEQHRYDAGKGDGKTNSHANVESKGKWKGKGDGEAHEVKGRGKDAAKGKWPYGPRDPSAKGKGDGKSAKDAKPDKQSSNPNDFCWFAQTDWNGGYKCYNPKCPKSHEKARTEEFYKKIPIPQFAIDRGLHQRPATPRKDRHESESNLANARPSQDDMVVKPDWNIFCKTWVDSNFTKCDEHDAGKCTKRHPDARQYNINLSRSAFKPGSQRRYRNSPRGVVQLWSAPCNVIRQ